MLSKDYGDSLPTRKRSCTDIICALIFIIFTVLSGVAAFYGFSKGDVSNIIPPYDSSGNRCGKDKAKDFPYLYFKTTDPTAWVDHTACVKACPKTKTDKIECFVNKQVTKCDDLPSR